ncbi:hypothetical protein DFH08DRAFT_970604 [Mycena albidolilacea]|uniref:Uncharacterized protein n=1 Tax=Mycena albidolilacea TaxID=1033008 RepID=A0AAD6ZGK3_9AGAR|nr:hypothetical protein DFH08DRAFT_970604 [Mycena albidolilacea]
MNALQTANGNCCIHCGNQLTVEVAEGGKVPGSSFIRPFKPILCTVFVLLQVAGLGVSSPIALEKSAVAIASNTLVPVVRIPMTKTAKWWLLLRYPIYMLVSLTLALMTTGHQMQAPRSTLSRLTSAEKTPRVAMEWRLDGLFGVKSPTPEREWQEDADLQLAMELSLGQMQPHNSAPSPSHPMPRPSLRLPVAITRAAAPSATSTLAPRPLHITMQLNTDWMETASLQSTFHVKHSRPLKTPRCLMVVYWDEDHEPHAVFYIHLLLTWPMWQVAEATSHFATLLGDNPDLEVYDPRFKTWASVGPTYPHPIIADETLLLHRSNMQCLALDKVVHTFHPPPSTAPMHFRQNLPAERKALHTISDSDIKVVWVNKRAFKQEYEDNSVLRHAQLPRLDPDLIVIDDDDTPPLTASSLTSTLSLPSLSAALSPPWPAGMYIVDMVKGFRKMLGLKGMGLN